MKNRILHIVVLISLFTYPAFSLEKPTESVINQLEIELIELRKIDQAIRKELMDLMATEVSNKSASEIKEKFERVDRSNTKKVKKIISQYGWEIIEVLSKKAKRSLLLIVEHANENPEFQKSALKVFLSYYQKGLIKGQNLAILTDKILVAENKGQLYGTQVKIKDGTVTVYPIKDEDGLDERRKSLNLPTMPEYLKRLKEFYKIK